MCLLLTVLAALLLVFQASDWYAQQVSLPRFCHETELALARLAAVVGEREPVDDRARREYQVAAKLAFLVPAAADEPREVYLRRVRKLVARQCP